jgi:ABC-type phosphate transport system substrate-binding protein
MRFLEWILGEEGQKIAVDLGYIPLNKAVVAGR